MSTSAAIVRCLSQLAPGGRREQLDVTGVGGLAWLGTGGLTSSSMAGNGDPMGERTGPLSPITAKAVPDPDTRGASDALVGLARTDALHASEHVLRLGWAFLAGEVTIDGEAKGYCRPLLTMTVSVRKVPLVGWVVQPLSQWDLTLDPGDDAAAARLEATAQFGGGAFPGTDPTTEALARMPALTGWVSDVLSTCGLPAVALTGSEAPTASGPLRVVIGYGVYQAEDLDSIDLRASLAGWASIAGIESTAFAALYGTAPPVAPPSTPDPGPVWSPVVLAPAQEAVVARTRTETVTVVSGPPGTGKSQVSTAIALDAVARGQRVLMATRSAPAADVLAGLLERRPGPDPVLFGGGERADRLARLLGDGLEAPAGPATTDASRELADLMASIDLVLGGVLADAEYERLVPQMPVHRERAPGFFQDGADLAAAAALATRAGATAGFMAGWRRNRALARLRRVAGAGPSTGLDELTASLRVAGVARSSSSLPDTVAPTLWDSYAAVDEAWRDDYGRGIGRAVAAGLDPPGRRAVAALSSALRAGRAQRRNHLRKVDAQWLTRALPLWIGTLGDIEELLPQVPGMFDLVILDESSQIDQMAAAPALLRASRAVVVGDPRQLRFVSFVGDDEVRAAVAANGLSAWADRLDVRRVSAFDLAAGVAPVTMLDEHFRSLPHLIGFSAERFYEGRLTIATRHPATETECRIEVHAVADGVRADTGVNAAEVAAVAEIVDAVLATPGRSLGLVTPFRPQADALEEMVVARADLDRIRAADLRVGTVHAFQGDERDVMVLSLALDDEGRGIHFLQDPNLFNVLVSRARQRMVVVTSRTDVEAGLLADFLGWAATSPPPSPSGPPPSPWAAAVAEALAAGGTPVRTGFAVGRQRVDLCVGEGARAIGVETDVHPGGPAAHRARHLALRRAGWNLVDAFPGRFENDPVAAAVELATLVSG